MTKSMHAAVKVVFLPQRKGTLTPVFPPAEVFRRDLAMAYGANQEETTLRAADYRHARCRQQLPQWPHRAAAVETHKYLQRASAETPMCGHGCVQTALLFTDDAGPARR
jgi:hypothetical protein